MGQGAALIGAGLRTMLARRTRSLSDLNHWGAGARRIQGEQLSWLVRHASETIFGRDHDFAGLFGEDSAGVVNAFRDRVPIQTYDDLLPLLSRMREQGEPDVTWPGLVRDWAQTSGTTSGDKFIPVSKEMLRHNRKASYDVFANAMRFGVDLPDVFSGKLLFLGGSTDVVENRHGVRTGDLSGIVTSLIRWPISAVYMPGKDIALMSDWPVKIDRMAERCLDADIRWIAGMASWSLVLMERMVELAHERGRPERTLRELWPSLRIFVHGGVKYTPFERRVRQMWSGSPDGDDIPTRLEVYAASEGFIAVQDTPGDPGLRLNLDHRIFYEFVPLEEIDSENPSAFTCDEVEKGQRYVVVMSTCAGLWRYIIGDVVEFDTIPPDGPPRLRIVGRHRHFINAFGENLIIEHIENAVVDALKTLPSDDIRIGEFTAAPVYPGEGRRAGLELAVEWEGDAALADRFSQAVDESLKSQNVDYGVKRSGDRGMAPPTITTLPLGSFHRWLESRGKLGGQHKCPRCANHREIIDSVINIGRGNNRPLNDVHS
ncbi:MAG: hypothetical protein EA376_05805 [Phycisphaeraceae bacterium]|nr:MAG: hypothetical protein EA376_05805 [Phycisphaeraceae bacterium]